MNEALSETWQLQYTIEREFGWISYRAVVYDASGHRTGSAEVRRSKFTAAIDGKKYSGKIPSIFFGDITELADATNNSTILLLKGGDPAIATDQRGNDVYQIQRQFWKKSHFVTRGNRQVALLKKRGFFSMTHDLYTVDLSQDEARDLVALLAIIVLKEQRDAAVITAAS